MRAKEYFEKQPGWFGKVNIPRNFYHISLLKSWLSTTKTITEDDMSFLKTVSTIKFNEQEHPNLFYYMFYRHSIKDKKVSGTQHIKLLDDFIGRNIAVLSHRNNAISNILSVASLPNKYIHELKKFLDGGSASHRAKFMNIIEKNYPSIVYEEPKDWAEYFEGNLDYFICGRILEYDKLQPYFSVDFQAEIIIRVAPEAYHISSPIVQREVHKRKIISGTI